MLQFAHFHEININISLHFRGLITYFDAAEAAALLLRCIFSRFAMPRHAAHAPPPVIDMKKPSAEARRLPSAAYHFSAHHAFSR
jgi:hypothetical protein